MNFRAHDPAWSKQFLDLLIGAYLDYHAHISHDPAAEQFFSQQAKLLQAKLDDAEEQLRAFQVKSGITSVDDQRSGLVDRLDTLQLQLDKNQADLAYNEQQAISFKEMLDQTPDATLQGNPPGPEHGAGAAQAAGHATARRAR